MPDTPALQLLASAIESPPAPGIALGNWRWTVRQHVVAVRDELMVEARAQDNAWLAARRDAVVRERTALLGRLAEMAPEVLAGADVEEVQAKVRRLIADIQRHRQRLRDLAYDDVEVEYGGSE